MRASMRPGQQRPGNGPGRVRNPADLSSFNEAGATTPRKPCNSRSVICILGRFNEAGATTPRKLDSSSFLELERRLLQ